MGYIIGHTVLGIYIISSHSHSHKMYIVLWIPNEFRTEKQEIPRWRNSSKNIEKIIEKEKIDTDKKHINYCSLFWLSICTSIKRVELKLVILVLYIYKCLPIQTNSLRVRFLDPFLHVQHTYLMYYFVYVSYAVW